MRCSSVLALLALAAGHVAAQEPQALDARLSPDGTTVAARVLDGESVRMLALAPYDTLGALGEPRWLTPPGVDVESAAWAPDGERVVYSDARDGRLYVVTASVDGGAPAPRGLTPGAAGEARLVGFAGDVAFVELPGELPGEPDLYRASLDGGEPTLVQRNDGGVTRWFVDAGMARLVMRAGEGDDREIARLREGVAVPIYPCGEAEVCEPVGFHPDGRVWVRTNRDLPAPALVLVDPLMLEVEVVRSDLGADPAAFIREDSVYARDVARLQELLPEAEVTFHDASGEGGGRLLVTARDADGATLYLFDRWAGSVARVLPLADETVALAAFGLPTPVPDATLAWPEELRYVVSDGEPGMAPTDVRRTVQRTTLDGRDVLVVVDLAEVPVFPAFPLDTALFADPAFEPDLDFSMDDLDTVEATDSTVLDATTLRPIRRRATGPFSVELAFGADGVRGTVTMDGFRTRVSAAASGPVWSDGASLEMLVAALPLAAGYETDVDYFDSGLQEIVTARLSVDAATRAEVEAGDFDAWSLTISPSADGAGEWTWLVRRAAPHLLLRATVESRDYDRTTELVEGGDSP